MKAISHHQEIQHVNKPRVLSEAVAKREYCGVQETGKPNHSNPGANRPISHHNTLGKLLEAVVARRLSYLAQRHSLLL
jgi:hypothetical protein